MTICAVMACETEATHTVVWRPDGMRATLYNVCGTHAAWTFSEDSYIQEVFPMVV